MFGIMLRALNHIGIQSKYHKLIQQLLPQINGCTKGGMNLRSVIFVNNQVQFDSTKTIVRYLFIYHFIPFINSVFQVSCHIEDIPENGADPGHLPAIHKTSMFSGGEPTKWTTFASLWGWHEYSLAWRPKNSHHLIKCTISRFNNVQ